MKNRQPHYAILGDGRLARHMRRYLSLLDQPTSYWSRQNKPSANTHQHPDTEARLRQTLAPATHVLLLVSDAGIAELLARYPFLRRHTLIHCAGAITLPGVIGAHPLMTFGQSLHTLDEYAKIPFVLDAGADFLSLFPALANPHFTLPVEQKAGYHALCVMAGNFPQLLWQAISQRLQNDLALPPDIMEPYLRQAVENAIKTPETALTGPLVRGDHGTLERNSAALQGDPLQALYQSFVDFYTADQAELMRSEAS